MINIEGINLTLEKFKSLKFVYYISIENIFKGYIHTIRNNDARSYMRFEILVEQRKKNVVEVQYFSERTLNEILLDTIFITENWKNK